MFPEATFRFLRGIGENNSKAWFDAHRADYEASYVEPAKAFVNALGPRLRELAASVQYDARVNGSIFRINRDIRFAKDKTPYKDHMDLWFWLGEGRGWDAPGFFLRLGVDRLDLGAGIHRFEKSQLETYRRKAGAVAKIAEQVEAAGYRVRGGPRNDFARYTGLWAEYDEPLDGRPTNETLVDFCMDHYRAMWPLARWIETEIGRRSRP